jgi:hypothetical protein
MSLIDIEVIEAVNPVDLIETIASTNDWSFERTGDDEITITVTGSWCDYNISLSWMEGMEALHLACAFDFKINDLHKPKVMKLLACINEMMWVGHFDIWQAEGVVMYRHALLLTDGAEAGAGQLEGMLGTAVDSCERYYQTFQYVLWGGKTPKEAIAAVLFETVGEA